MAAAPPPPPPVPTEDIAHMHIHVPTELEKLENEHWFELTTKGATAGDIHSINWKDAIGFSASTEGSEGVLFVQFKDLSIVIMKASSTQAADVFAADLAILVGISVPDFRIVKQGVDAEHQVIKDTLNTLDETNNPLQRGKHTKMIERPVLSIIEFIRGKSLFDLDPHDIFGRVRINVRGGEFIKEIAKIVSYDVVINNWDRVPIIWDNEGNPDNILFTTSKKRMELHPVAIDNTITSIDPSNEENYAEYMDKVRYLLNEFSDNWGEPPIFKNVRDKFPNTCFSKQPSMHNARPFFKRVFQDQYDIGEEGTNAFAFGFVDAVMLFSKVSETDIQKLRDNVELQMSASLQHCGMNHESVALHKINLDFLNDVMKIYREATPVLERIQKKISVRCSVNPPLP